MRHAFPSQARDSRLLLEQLGSHPAVDAEDYARRPDLFGLSPSEVRKLLAGDWYTRGPLRLNRNVRLDELGDASYFADLRELLLALADAGRVPARRDGTFEGHFASTLGERLWSRSAPPPGPEDADLLEDDEEPPWMRGEEWLPVTQMRETARYLGCLRVRTGSYELTPLGRRLATPEGAGSLYTRLLRALFRNANVRDTLLLPLPEGPVMHQGGEAYEMWGLGQVDGNWWIPAELGLMLSPPWTRDVQDVPPWLVGTTVELGFLIPLASMGLIEEWPSEAESWGPDAPADDEHMMRRAPLYDRVVRFPAAFGPRERRIKLVEEGRASGGRADH